VRQRQAAKMLGLAERWHGNQKEADFNLRENSPLARHILLHPEMSTGVHGPVNEPKGYRGWVHFVTSPKDDMGYLIYPMSVQDTAKSGTGCV